MSDQTICQTDIMATCAAILGYDLPHDAAEDSFITIGDSSTYTLPSVKSISEEALALINA